MIRGQNPLYTTSPTTTDSPSCSVVESEVQKPNTQKDGPDESKCLSTKIKHLKNSSTIYNYLYNYFLFTEEYKLNIFYYLIDVLSTVSQFITRTSYIGTNIVMMVSLVFSFQ